MSKIDIKNFYKAAVERKEFNSDFWNDVKKISTEGELKAFIEEKVQPVAKKMGYDFSTKELLNYEKQMVRRITEQQLETVNGGVSTKNLALGGIFSLMALGAGIVGTTNSASAELTTQDVAKSTEVMRAIIDVNVQASKSRNGDWLHLTTESNSTEALNLTYSMLESFLKEAGFSNVSEIKAIQAKNAQGQILDVKLDKELVKLFSESKEIPGALWGTWGKANAKKIKATKSMYGGWLYLTTDSNSTEALTLTRSMLESFLKESGFSDVSEIQAIQARNAKGQILDIKLNKDLVKLFSKSKEIPGALWGTWGKANTKKDIPDADAEQTVAETHGLGDEQPTVGISDLRTEQVVSDTSDLETAQAATKVEPKEVFETRKLTDGQQLYAYEALNLQEAYALLKSGVVENVRFYGNIMEIETVNSIRRYTSDKGDAFTELLYMLYPSPAGVLNTDTGFRGRDSFAMHGGMSLELAAKFFAILNDCRNNKVEIPGEFTSFTSNGEAGTNSFSYINPEFKKALVWLKAKGLLAAEDFEKVKAVEDAIKRVEELKKILDGVDIDSLKFEHRCIDGSIKYKGELTDYFDLERGKLENEPETNKAKLEIIEKLKGLTREDLNPKRKELKQEIDSYHQKNKELQLKLKSIKENEISKKAKFLMHFINTMKEATKLEVTDGSSYPKYLTEHILMSYMCQTLNNSEDVRELYQKIAEQLSQNETNKKPTPEEEKAAIVAKIAAKKEEIARLNDIINEVEFQVLSPYKSATQSNGTTFKIGTIGEDGNVQIQDDTFADCADIAARHIINLLTFANEQNWDLILKGANVRELNAKLKEVVDAIENKSQVKFYDLKTRLQMFFLYQRGFIEGVDNEEDREYRSKNGADDVTPLARTLWEYVICNMNTENLGKGPDKNKGLYPIVYARRGRNYELKSGYINMLKLMWNIASALNLKSDALSLAKSKINALSELEEYNETAFKEALSSTFALFNESDGIEFTLTGCEYAKINGNNEVKGNVTVDITKGDQKLNFTIYHYSGHGEAAHNPINFNVYKYLEKYYKNSKRALEFLKTIQNRPPYRALSATEIDFWNELVINLNEHLNSFAKLLLKSFVNNPYGSEEIATLTGFYGVFAESKLRSNDDFRGTDLYKKFKALHAFKTLQGEENNINRINRLLDIETMRGAKEIVVKRLTKGEDGKQQITEENLCDVFYREFLEPHEKNRDRLLNIGNSICFHDFGEIEEIYDERGEKQENIGFDIIKINEGGEVQLFIKNTPENGELIIPSTVYDKDRKKYKVTRINRYANINFENLKIVKYTGDFDNLEISEYFWGNAKDNLQTVEINGNIKNLKIEWRAFDYCEALKNIIIRGNVEKLDIASDFLNSLDAKIFLPENSKNEIPESFKDKNKIVFYGTTNNGTLHLKVNEAVSEILLDKETLETLGGNFQILQAKNLNEESVEIMFDDDLKDEFLKIEDATGLHYERKRV